METQKSFSGSTLRHDFARATSGSDRARTATFINANLADLGVCEWMEAYSLNGADWTLKRMVLYPHEGNGVIHQHTQTQHPTMNFITALQSLVDYETAQAALGYVIDADDRGQVTGTPLLRDVAKTEGIPHDVNGRLVIPQKGHIVDDGAYPLDAFAVAAAGQVKNMALFVPRAGGLVPVDTSLILRQQDENGAYEISSEVKRILRSSNEYVKQGLDLVRQMNLSTLLNHRYRLLRCEIEYDRVMGHGFCVGMATERINGYATYTRDLPQKLLAYLRYQFVGAEVALRGIMASSMIRQKDAMLLAGENPIPRVEATLQKAISEWRSAQHEFEPLFRHDGADDIAQLRAFNIDDAFLSVEHIIDLVNDTARCLSVDLSALPDLPVAKQTMLAKMAALQAARPPNTGPR